MAASTDVGHSDLGGRSNGNLFPPQRGSYKEIGMGLLVPCERFDSLILIKRYD